jgi:hypothetical protein
MKRWLAIAATVLGLGAGVAVFFPQAAPVVPVLKGLQVTLEAISVTLTPDCVREVCTFDPRDGRNHTTGPIAFTDGGSCFCPAVPR